MRIANRTTNMVAFRMTLPSKRVFRLELKGGEVIDTSNAIAMALEDHAYFQELVHTGKLEVIEKKPAPTPEVKNDAADQGEGN